MANAPLNAISSSICQTYTCSTKIGYIYIYDLHSACNTPHLLKLGITHRLDISNHDSYEGEEPITSINIVNISVDDSVQQHLWREERSTSCGIVKLSIIGIDDTPAFEISSVFEVCHKFMNSTLNDNKTNKLLVNCMEGKSRSSSIVIAYLMKRNSSSLRRELNNVKRLRPAIRPNNGFFNELRVYDVLHNNGVDSMPFETVEYIRWTLEHPNGEGGQVLGCCVIL